MTGEKIIETAKLFVGSKSSFDSTKCVYASKEDEKIIYLAGNFCPP